MGQHHVVIATVPSCAIRCNVVEQRSGFVRHSRKQTPLVIPSLCPVKKTTAIGRKDQGPPVLGNGLPIIVS